MSIESIRSIIDYAKCHRIEINEVTVDPDMYENLLGEAIRSSKYLDVRNGLPQLRIYNVIINRRECKGCCTHGSSNS